MTGIQDIDHSIRITAPLDRVWLVMTHGRLVEEWLGCMGFELKVGSLFYMQPDSAKRAAGDLTGATHCQLLEVEQPYRIRFSWFMPGTPKTEVTLSLQAKGPGETVARLTHTGWEQFRPEDIRAIRDMLDGGWSSQVLPNFKRLAES